MKTLLLFLSTTLAAGHAATLIQVETRLADVPAGIKLPATPEKLDAVKGVTVLSAPKITLKENTEGMIEVAEAVAVPGGGAAPLGVKVALKTKITEKGNVWFSGVVTDRSRSGSEKGARMETAGFATRELYFSGWTPGGETVLLRTSPATAKTTQDGKPVASSRELVIYMTLEKISEPTPAAKSGAKSPVTKKKK